MATTNADPEQEAVTDAAYAYYRAARAYREAKATHTSIEKNAFVAQQNLSSAWAALEDARRDLESAAEVER